MMRLHDPDYEEHDEPWREQQISNDERREPQ